MTYYSLVVNRYILAAPGTTTLLNVRILLLPLSDSMCQETLEK